MRRLLAIALAVGLALGLSPGAHALPKGTSGGRLAANPGLFLNILPAGQGTTTTPAEAIQFEADGTLPPHDGDQQHMYDSLRIVDPAALTDADLSKYFKPESFGVTGGVESSGHPIGSSSDHRGIDAALGGDVSPGFQWGVFGAILLTLGLLTYLVRRRYLAEHPDRPGASEDPGR